MLQYPASIRSPSELGPIKVHWYGIMYLIGFAAAWWLGRRARQPPEFDLEAAATSMTWCSSACWA